jgi:hypothetical protein
MLKYMVYLSIIVWSVSLCVWMCLHVFPSPSRPGDGWLDDFSRRQSMLVVSACPTRNTHLYVAVDKHADRVTFTDTDGSTPLRASLDDNKTASPEEVAAAGWAWVDVGDIRSEKTIYVYYD